LTGLIPDTKYYIKAYAYTKAGVGFGNEVTFTTLPIVGATLTTTDVTSITSSSAISGGNIIDDGGGIITARGVCWATNANPTVTEEHTTDGTGTGSFISNINCLSFATTYYVRAYANNSAGTTYGDQQSFITQGTNPIIFNPNLTYGSVSDVDGNCYKTIQIGTQTWMAENLKTTKFNEGNEIPNVIDNAEWESLKMPAYCWNFNDRGNKDIYGALYNWYVVNNGKLCPTGWHVPTFEELNILCDPYYNPDDLSEMVGYELMETGTTYLDQGFGTNVTGFTSVSGGVRYPDGTFAGVGVPADYWSSTNAEPYIGYAKCHPIPYNFPRSPGRRMREYSEGLSVRCIKD